MSDETELLVKYLLKFRELQAIDQATAAPVSAARGECQELKEWRTLAPQLAERDFRAMGDLREQLRRWVQIKKEADALWARLPPAERVGLTSPDPDF